MSPPGSSVAAPASAASAGAAAREAGDLSADRRRAPIPRTLHYVFGLAADSRDRAWRLHHYACVQSALAHIQPTRCLFHCEHEPTGRWWELTRPFVEVVPTTAPREVFGNPLVHFAHRADVVRLQRLREIGGVYLDSDVLVVRDVSSLLDHDCVLGQEGEDGRIGLCNAVILARPDARFLDRWLESYRTFRSLGRDRLWNEHSVRIPKQLASLHPDEVHVLDHKSFFWPTWTDSHLRWMFESTRPLETPDAFAHHLWQTRAGPRHLRSLTVRQVLEHDTNFHRLIRPYVAHLGVGFDEPSRLRRAASSVFVLQRRARRVATSALAQFRSAGRGSP